MIMLTDRAGKIGELWDRGGQTLRPKQRTSPIPKCPHSTQRVREYNSKCFITSSYLQLPPAFTNTLIMQAKPFHDTHRADSLVQAARADRLFDCDPPVDSKFVPAVVDDLGGAGVALQGSAKTFKNIVLKPLKESNLLSVKHN